MVRNLIAITDASEISRLEMCIGKVVESPGSLNKDWLVENNMVAVPVESAGHFDNHDAAQLAYAIKTENVSRCFAIASEPLKNFPCYYSMGTETDDLLAFSRECAHFNFLLIPASLSFAVLCTVFDYYIVSGTRLFVENAVGCGIEDAHNRFLEYAAASGGESDRLVAVSRRYHRGVKRGRS